MQRLLPQSTPSNILPLIHIANTNAAYKIETDELRQDKWDEFYLSQIAPFTVGTQRDYKFLKWRYMDSPILKYSNTNL